jgi:hypothetical protein
MSSSPIGSVIDIDLSGGEWLTGGDGLPVGGDLSTGDLDRRVQAGVAVATRGVGRYTPASLAAASCRRVAILLSCARTSSSERRWRLGRDAGDLDRPQTRVRLSVPESTGLLFTYTRPSE